MSRQTAVPPGATILVTGGTGFVGSHVIDHLLAHPNGYRVRACVRSDAKAAPLVELVEKKYTRDRLELVHVPDMVQAGAYDAALDADVKGVVHVAADVSFQPYWDEVVVPTQEGVRNILSSIAKAPAVQRVVLTSSSVALGQPIPVPRSKWDPASPLQVFTPEKWDDEMVEWTRKQTELQKQGAQKDEDAQMMRMACYATGKILSEKVAWEWAKEHQDRITFTTVHPNAVLGAPILKNGGASVPGDWVWDLYKGKTTTYGAARPQWYNHVQDVAVAHVAAIADADVGNERILAFSGMFGWNDVTQSLAKSFPQAKVAPLQQGDEDTVDSTKVHNERFVAICGGKLKDFDQSVRDTIEGLQKSGAKAGQSQ
ncbi:unnamed protein product [Parajaminaea phylloscopi]